MHYHLVRGHRRQPGGTSSAEAEKVMADYPVVPFVPMYRCLDCMDILADARRPWSPAVCERSN